VEWGGINLAVGILPAAVFEGRLTVLFKEEPARVAAKGGLQPVPGVARLLTCCSSIPA
jgi:hypothetical protein